MSETPANDAPHRLIDGCEFGDRVVVHAFTNLYGCRVGSDTRIGPFVEVQSGVSIGARCKVQSHSFICEGVRIEDEVFVGHGVIFINDKHPLATNPNGSLRGGGDWQMLETRVERRASIGSGALILGGLTVGPEAIIGAGAVVTADVPPGGKVTGVPARAVRGSAGAGSSAND
jgi:UDP-2-acetamido-3-amino-2,3-dideoxy-glucuronate N-acetyltransferase